MNTGCVGKRNVTTRLMGFHPCDKSSAGANEMYALSTPDSKCLQMLGLGRDIAELWRPSPNYTQSKLRKITLSSRKNPVNFPYITFAFLRLDH